MNSFEIVSDIDVTVYADFERFLHKRTPEFLFLKYAVHDVEFVKNVAVTVHADFESFQYRQTPEFLFLKIPLNHFEIVKKKLLLGYMLILTALHKSVTQNFSGNYSE